MRSWPRCGGGDARALRGWPPACSSSRFVCAPRHSTRRFGSTYCMPSPVRRPRSRCPTSARWSRARTETSISARKNNLLFSDDPYRERDSPEHVRHTFGFGLIRATDGNLYGTSSRGGLGFGTIVRVASTGVVTTVYTFQGGYGGEEPGSLLQARDGNRLRCSGENKSEPLRPVDGGIFV